MTTRRSFFAGFLALAAGLSAKAFGTSEPTVIRAGDVGAEGIDVYDRKTGYSAGSLIVAVCVERGWLERLHTCRHGNALLDLKGNTSIVREHGDWGIRPVADRVHSPEQTAVVRASRQLGKSTRVHSCRCSETVVTYYWQGPRMPSSAAFSASQTALA